MALDFGRGDLGAARKIAILLPAALLLGALGFQFLGSLPPCEMCIWQRWPLLAGLLLGVASLALSGAPARILLFSAGVAILLSSAIGAFHAGVEYGWWDGLTGCSTNASSVGLSDEEMLRTIMAAPIIRCDVAPWTLGGISLAGYNAILAGLGGLAVLALVAKATRSMR